MLIVSDGTPNDDDVYEGQYGINDTRQAVAEARWQGITVFCLTVERTAPRYAARVFGRYGFAVLTTCRWSSWTCCANSFAFGIIGVSGWA